MTASGAAEITLDNVKTGLATALNAALTSKWSNQDLTVKISPIEWTNQTSGGTMFLKDVTFTVTVKDDASGTVTDTVTETATLYITKNITG